MVVVLALLVVVVVLVLVLSLASRFVNETRQSMAAVIVATMSELAMPLAKSSALSKCWILRRSLAPILWLRQSSIWAEPPGR